MGARGVEGAGLYSRTGSPSQTTKRRNPHGAVRRQKGRAAVDVGPRDPDPPGRFRVTTTESGQFRSRKTRAGFIPVFEFRCQSPALELGFYHWYLWATCQRKETTRWVQIMQVPFCSWIVV